MGWFTEDEEVELAPRPPESTAGGDWLLNFMRRWGPAGATTQYPVQGVAGLTPLQQQLQTYLDNYLSGGTQGYNLAMGQTERTLGGGYDPRTSPYYQGLKQEAGRLRKEGGTAIRQSANLGGMLKSSPARALESEYGQKIDSALLSELGRLYETERDRQERAAGTAAGLGGQQFGQLITGAGLAEQPRTIEQMQADAVYNAMMSELLHPYEYQAVLARAMMGYTPGTNITGGGASDLGLGLGTGASLLSSYWAAHQ